MLHGTTRHAHGQHGPHVSPICRTDMPEGGDKAPGDTGDANGPSGEAVEAAQGQGKGK